MCEIRVVMEQNGGEDLVMENVTKLDVSDSSITITSLFEGSRKVDEAVIRSIDFVAGKVYLHKH